MEDKVVPKYFSVNLSAYIAGGAPSFSYSRLLFSQSTIYP